ncbi:hypothetical protein IQ260_17290 [Leptolyngbya cf. ectocarpi LEGE 11479]|uniref:Trypsin-co-occurring domain-containing protein n=1 Tax=Leptolyngbya cf. ectocarpi LEGE 11479 TaxID=1828722 RepID=A0A929FAS1_LEPEC|nr:CU044_2847 family protein [Leptolyngbya ectocarpi]MBE9068409.1 hypothetical protein [Leptolyngbya cf. ectocarpi LEGE 11479]
MTQYIQFDVEEKGKKILVEVEEEEVTSSEEGLVKVGIRDIAGTTVAVAKSTFSDAVKEAVVCNVNGLMTAVDSLANPPTEIEINFGLKVTGQAGNIAVGKVGGEVNYGIKLSWKHGESIDKNDVGV